MNPYEELSAGRRREWWKRRKEQSESTAHLTPEEQMKRLIADAESEPSHISRKSQPNAKPDPGANEEPIDFGLPEPPPDPSAPSSDAAPASPPEAQPRVAPTWTRERRLAQKHAKDLEEWQKTRRQVIVMSMIAGSVLLTVILLYTAGYFVSNTRIRSEIQKAMQRAERREAYKNLSSPVHALGTYCSAWLRGDMRAVWDITTPDIQRDIVAVRDVEQHIRSQQELYRKGAFQDWINVIRAMKNPEFILRPKSPYGDGDLAAFRSQPHAPLKSKQTPIRYVIVFTFKRDQWLFVRSYPENVWKTTWTSFYQLRPQPLVEKTIR